MGIGDYMPKKNARFGNLMGWQLWADGQGSDDERSIGASVVFAKHERGPIGFWVTLEVCFLFTVQFGWNWY